MGFGIWLGAFNLKILGFWLVFLIKGFWILLSVLWLGFCDLAMGLVFRLRVGFRVWGLGFCFDVRGFCLRIWDLDFGLRV